MKSVRVEEAAADEKRELKEHYLFDRTGRLIEERHRTALSDSPERSGYQVLRYIYKPKEQDYEIDAFRIDPAQGEKAIDLQRHFVKFNSLGHCLEERDIDTDGSLDGRSTYEYDNHGDLIKETNYNFDGSVSSIQQRTYSPDHKLLLENVLANGDGQSSREYRYDAFGRQTDLFLYQQGVLEAHWISKYDDRGRLLSYETVATDPAKDQHVYGRCFDCGLSSGETTYKYDEAGRVIEERVFQPGHKLITSQTHFYDLEGTELNWPDSVYSYDSYGNWIKEESSKSHSVRYRVTDYY